MLAGIVACSAIFAGCAERGGSGARDVVTVTATANCPVVTTAPSASPVVAAVPSDGAAQDKAPPAPETAPIRLAFVGDVALNYSIAKDLEAIAQGKAPSHAEPGFPFAGVSERLKAADLAVANLECVVSTKGKVDTWHKPFRAPVSGIDAILASGIDVVSVANNHSFDFGQEAFDDMLRNLDEKKLPVVGRGYRQKTRHEPERATIREIRGTRIGLLGFYLADDADLTRDIGAARKEADLVVVYFHWGKEKQSDATPEQRRQAHVAIDAGADLVVGSHVHVLQPTEVYKGKLVAYGLGNFVFMGMNNEERFRRGAILEVAMTRERLVSFEMVPTRVDDHGAPRIVVPESSYLPSKLAGGLHDPGAER